MATAPVSWAAPSRAPHTQPCATGTLHRATNSALMSRAPTRNRATRRRALRWLAAVGVLVVLVVVFLVGGATPALAHASFMAAEPPPGRGLAEAPDAVVLEFTEALVRPPSRIEVFDESGENVGEGETLAVEGNPNAMRRELGPLTPGLYTVEWTTLSPVDGHTLSGSYRFAIGGATMGEEVVAAGPVSSEGALGLAGRFVGLAGLALWAGAAALDGAAGQADAAQRTRRVLRRAGPPLAAGGTAVALASTALVSAGSLSALGQVALTSQSGLLRTTVVAAGVLASLPPVARRGGDRWLVVAALPAEAASGHAGSNPSPLLATVSFAGHLAAVGVWGYAVAVSALAGERVRRTLAAFVPYAIGAAVVVGVTGLANAALVLTGPGDLVTTGYGRAVAVKGAVLVVAVTLGAVHHLARRRGLARPWLALPVRAEALALAGGVLVATLLVGFPDPPREQAAHDAATEPDIALADLADHPAVSAAAVAGPYVVGLTVTPPEPGAVEVWLHVLGVEAGDGLRDASLRATRPGGEAVAASLDPCGPGCFAGEATLASEGRWTLHATVDSNRHPIDVSVDIPLPARDGTKRFARTMAAMEDLRTAVVHETLKGSETGQPVTSRYTFQAPDRMRWDVTSGGSTRIAVGQAGYRKSTPDQPFESHEWPGDGFSWPEGFYDSFFGDRVAVRILGPDTLDGADTTVISFVQPRFPAWHRLWISDETGRVRRLEMRANAHLMDQTYGSYDQPLTVEPPHQEGQQ